MAAPREAFESRQSVSRDARGQRAGERLFFTDYRDPTAAIADVTFSVVPAYNSQYPGDSAMLLDKKSAEVRPDGTYQVRCLYSTDQRYKSNTIDKKNTTYFSWQGSTTKAQEYYWVVINRKMSLPAATGGGAPVTKNIWQGVKAPITERRQAVTLSIRTANVTTPSPFAAIAAQTEKLHLLGGASWLFLGGEATRHNQEDWEFTYRWELDIGTQAIESPDPTQVSIPPIEGSGYSAYSRPPYCDTYYVDAADPTLYLGKVYATPRYKKDDNGWRSLPGISGVTGL